MLDALTRRAFFQFEIPIRYLEKVPRIDADVRKWTPEFLLPALVALDELEPFADVYAGWNEHGLAVAFDVRNGRSRLECDPKQWWSKDGLRLCIDTRDARDNKRATRFCHFFYLLPTGGGKNAKSPIVGLHRMSRAKEPPPSVELERIKLAAHLGKGGYSVEAYIPAECLNGWDPAEHPRIGLFYKVKDVQLGDQHFSVDDELGWNADPGTWATAVLQRDD